MADIFAHKYPFSQFSTNLFDLGRRLKGPDAALKRTCESLALSATVKALYRDSEDTLLMDHFPDFRSPEESNFIEHFRSNDGGLVVSNNSGDAEDYSNEERIVWIRPLVKMNPFASAYLHYGNESTLTFTYGEICLVVSVPRAEERI